MPVYDIRNECNGRTEQSHEGVELADFAAAGAYALSSARPFRDLAVPGERRKCAFEVRDASEGLRLRMELSVSLDSAEPATDDLDGGLPE